jgi:hypothetical protein
MGNFLETALDDVGSFITKIGKDLFGSDAEGHSIPTDGSLTDLRFEGMSNAQLASYVTQLGQGPGAAGLTQTADTLADISQSLQQLDQTIQQQLQAIGVNWQSTASDLAQEMTSTSAAYGGSVSNVGTQAGGSMNNQGEAYSSAKNSSATPQNLQPLAQGPALQQITSHATDMVPLMNQTNAARNQTVDALNNYAQSSQTNLNSFHPLPAPPAINLTTAPAATGTSSVTQVSAFTPSGPSFAGVSGGGAPGGSNAPGANTASGPGFQFPGGGNTAVPGSPAPGTPVPNSPVAPGPVSGVGPGVSPAALGEAQAAAGAGNAFGALVEDASIGAGIAGGSVAAGIAGSAGAERVVRGPSTTGEPGEGAARSGANALAELDEEEAAAARVTSRISGPPPAESPSMMEPAVASRRRDEDDEHDRRYVLTSDEIFGDDRMVSPPVFGATPEPEPPARSRRPEPEAPFGMDALRDPDPRSERD